MKTELDLAEIKVRCEALDTTLHYVSAHSDGDEDFLIVRDWNDFSSAASATDFYANAPLDVSALVAEVERLRKFKVSYDDCIDALPSGVNGPGLIGAILHMIEKLDEYRDEIERLRALVETAYREGWHEGRSVSRQYDHPQEQIDEAWESSDAYAALASAPTEEDRAARLERAEALMRRIDFEGLTDELADVLTTFLNADGGEVPRG